MCTERRFKETVAALFPQEAVAHVPIPQPPKPPDDPFYEDPLWDKLRKQISKDMKQLARKAGPAMDGSRFEHWFGASKEVRELTALLGVQWAQGRVPEVVYRATRLGRLLTPWKPNKAGLRPLVITAALRRIVLRALAKVLTQKAQGQVGGLPACNWDEQRHREAIPRSTCAPEARYAQNGRCNRPSERVWINEQGLHV